MRNAPLAQIAVSDAPVDEAPGKTTALRYTIDGRPELESRLDELCERARRAVENAIPASTLDGMLLGGGYGRGEGGVLRTPTGDRPYNDLEFYVFLKGPALLSERRFQPILHHAAEQLSKEAELDIELRVTSLRKLRQSPPNMFYYDLVLGHRWVIGEENLLRGCEHHWQAEHIPASEGTRVLLNRCSGLLFSRQRLRREAFTAEDADFVARNIAKAKLALGDVLLTLLGQYHWSCRERNRRLLDVRIDVPWLAHVQQMHTEGVEFKLHPHQSTLSRGELQEIHEDISSRSRPIWLWVESQRLKANFGSVEEYSFSPDNKCPETHAWKNACINLRIFRRSAPGRNFFRYPRERLLNSLPLLLWSAKADTAGCNSILWEAPVLRFLQRELRTRSGSFDSLVETYRNLWSRFN